MGVRLAGCVLPQKNYHAVLESHFIFEVFPFINKMPLLVDRQRTILDSICNSCVFQQDDFRSVISSVTLDLDLNGLLSLLEQVSLAISRVLTTDDVLDVIDKT